MQNRFPRYTFPMSPDRTASIKQYAPDGSHAQEWMNRLHELRPSIFLSKSWGTRQVTVQTTPTLVIANDRPHIYIVANIAATDIFLGNSEASLANGFPLTQDERLVFAMGENVRLFGIASAPVVLYILDMGI